MFSSMSVKLLVVATAALAQTVNTPRTTPANLRQEAYLVIGETCHRDECFCAGSRCVRDEQCGSPDGARAGARPVCKPRASTATTTTITTTTTTTTTIVPCVFLREPSPFKFVSNNPTTPFRIRFALKGGEACHMKVTFPKEGVKATFVLPANVRHNTKTFAVDNDAFTSDKVYMSGRRTLVIGDVNEDEFGSRFGKYQLNEKEVYGVPYSESVYRPVLSGSSTCTPAENDTFSMGGKVGTTRSFQRCVEYNEEKKTPKADYLFVGSFPTQPTQPNQPNPTNHPTPPVYNDVDEDISFELNVEQGQEHYVRCRIKTKDDRVVYQLRFLSDSHCFNDVLL